MTRPSYGRWPDATVTPTEILATNRALEHKMGVQIDTDVATKLVKGTIMGIVTASKLAIPYVDAAVDGSGVAAGVLIDDYDPTLGADQNDLRLNASIYIHGDFVEANLVGLDAAAKTDLKARTVGAWLTF